MSKPPAAAAPAPVVDGAAGAAVAGLTAVAGVAIAVAVASLLDDGRFLSCCSGSGRRAVTVCLLGMTTGLLGGIGGGTPRAATEPFLGGVYGGGVGGPVLVT